jgi:methyltransferase
VSPPPAPWPALAAYLVWLLGQRLFELAISARHARALLARGAVESARDHFGLIVALHVLFPLGVVAEVLWLGARTPAYWPLCLAGLVAGHALRLAAMRALGERWNVRVLALPGEPPVRRGIYRWLRHPNYLGVAIELLCGPLLFGAWRTALVATLWNALAMARRIPAEEQALGLRPPGPARGR